MISTDLNYPDSLPYPTRDNYGLNHVSPFTRTPMDSGRSRQRRSFSSVPTNVTVSWMFTEQETLIFESWFRDTIHDGADWFNCPLKTPIGSKPYVCRFTEMYKGPTPDGICMWRITAALEIWERPLLALGWGNFPDFIRYADIIDLAMNREWPEK